MFSIFFALRFTIQEGSTCLLWLLSPAPTCFLITSIPLLDMPPKRRRTTAEPAATSTPPTPPVQTPPVVVTPATSVPAVPPVQTPPVPATSSSAVQTPPVPPTSSSVVPPAQFPPVIHSVTTPAVFPPVVHSVTTPAVPPAHLDGNALAAAILGTGNITNPTIRPPLVHGPPNNPNIVTASDTLHLPLDSGVSMSTKEKIWTDQYIDLRQLLPNQTIDSQYTVALTNAGAAPILTLASRPSQHKQPLTLDQWTNAFLVFHYIYVQRHLAASSALVSYQHLIRAMAARGANWLRYDELFRTYRQSSITTPWNSPHLQLYIDALTTPLQTPIQTPQPQSTTNFRPTGSRRSTTSRIPMGYCFQFHKQNGKCLEAACPYTHTCPHCRSGGHKAYLCPRAQHRSNNQN
ncbi:mucin-2-like [Branchiostoma lanceolatum]|uniref:mucin-2-like n=1 Tax=Branchiostoma lanceolatum TaxID=7740 RepID=UPI0034511B22